MIKIKQAFNEARKFFMEPNPMRAETPTQILLEKIRDAGIQGVTALNDVAMAIGHATLPQMEQPPKAEVRQEAPRGPRF